MQGVGKETEIGYLNDSGITMLTEDDIKLLDEIYHIKLNYGKKNEKLKGLMID